MLGEAQEAAGSPEDALISYQHWLTLAGDEAAAWTVVKVQDLEAQLNAMLVADTAYDRCFRPSEGKPGSPMRRIRFLLVNTDHWSKLIFSPSNSLRLFN